MGSKRLPASGPHPFMHGTAPGPPPAPSGLLLHRCPCPVKVAETYTLVLLFMPQCSFVFVRALANDGHIATLQIGTWYLAQVLS